MCDLFYEDDLEFHKACFKALEQVTVLKRMDDAHKLLTLLLDTPGITQHELVTAHNFAPGLIYRCVEAALIQVRVQTIDARSVFRLYVTATGRASWAAAILAPA